MGFNLAASRQPIIGLLLCDQLMILSSKQSEYLSILFVYIYFTSLKDLPCQQYIGT